MDKTTLHKMEYTLDQEIAKVKKQLSIAKITMETLDNKLNELLTKKNSLRVDELVGLNFIEYGKLYRVTSVTIESHYQVVHYSKVLKNGSTGTRKYSHLKSEFTQGLLNGEYKKVQ